MKLNLKSKTARRVATGTLAAALLLGSAGALSDIVTKNIPADYMGIRLVVDGKEVTPKDARGRVVEPFASNGTTYLPVRAISEALDEDVDWDGTTRTVYVGLIPDKGTNWMKEQPPYELGGGDYTGHDRFGELAGIFDGTDPEHHFTVAGETYTTGMVLVGNHYANTDYYNGHALYNLRGRYKSMSFDIGHLDNTNRENAFLSVYCDEELVATYELQWNSAPQHIEIPLENVIGLRLELSRHDTKAANSCFGCFNVQFEK